MVYKKKKYAKNIRIKCLLVFILDLTRSEEETTD